MEDFVKYLILMKEYPSLFANSGKEGEFKIIHDPELIKIEQERIRKNLREKGDPETWIDIGVLAEDQWFWVIRDMVEFPDGKIGGYIRFVNRKSTEKGGFNVILMCIQGDKVLLIRRYRHEKRDFCWEFPRGFGEAELTAEENARKELLEETGLQALCLTSLANVVEEKGGTSVFYVEIKQGQKLKLSREEGIVKYEWVPLAKLDELALQGELNDWFSFWAYTLAKAKLNRGFS